VRPSPSLLISRRLALRNSYGAIGRVRYNDSAPMPTLLIVDDDATIRGMLYDLFSDRYECNTASSADEAFQYMEVEHYDAIITDIAMPGITGVELLKRVQLRDEATPVILISGKGTEHDSQSLLALGAFAYVTKPFSLEEIEQVVERALTKK
jgi:DNA-binding NtrC family response regulator